MGADTTPTLSSLLQSRARQQAVLRVLRPLALAAVVAVVLVGSRSQPRPGVTGERLGVLLALIGLALGVAGVLRGRRSGVSAQLPFFLVLVASANVLVWLQPHGPGLIGALVAAGVAALRVRGWVGVCLLTVVLASLATVGGLAGRQSGTTILLGALAVAAVYAVATLAVRLREQQAEAERLLIELERTRDAEARAAMLAERQRLAREIHDVLAHSLSGLVLQLEGARLLARDGRVSSQLALAVDRAHRLATSGLDEARRAIGMLRDDELPGPERVPALAYEFEHDTGVPCRTVVTGTELTLDAEARISVYRVAQEALTNVRKHAAPERVEVTLAYEPAGARLTVEDFGSVRRDAGGGGGYGLAGMRERADLIGGALDAGPTESGFRVDLWVPA
jgi:signal transduction histidine kinase